MSLAVTEDHRLLAETVRAVQDRQDAFAWTRKVADGGERKLPTTWDELVSLGWLGLAVREDVGGQGYGLAELAVVVFEMGRNVTPGPFLSTVWAAAILERCGDEALRRAYLPALVAGRRYAAVGLEPDALLGVDWAELALIPDGEDMVVIDRDDLEVEVLDSLDPTRPLGHLISPVVPSARLSGAAGTARDLGRTLAAVEASGVASACLEMANRYAKEREQFGRPIGGFQAVKHHLANMLVDTELAMASAWDAARAAAVAHGEPESDRQLHLAAAVAATEALDAAVRVAKTNMQVHGGIGFTWENSSHLFLRRAAALRAVFAGNTDPATEVTEAIRIGIRRTRTVDLPAEAETFRVQAAAFRDRLLRLPVERRRAELVMSGYLVPHWPKPWGRGAGPVEQLVVDEVLADIERPDLGIGGWVTLTIAQQGTPDQRDRFVGPSLRGELAFCQMFSEPGAGSDAAAIQTKATRVPGGWVVNGQKVWISNAQLCDRGLATVRTDPDAPKHRGVTVMLIDLRAAGIDIRPLRQITGEQRFNEVFFTDVFVPDDDVIGDVGAGWLVARATLGNERVFIGRNSAASTSPIDLVSVAPTDGRYDRELGQIISRSQALQALRLRVIARALAAREPGTEGNVTKLVRGELAQRSADLALRMAGTSGVAVGMSNPAYDFLHSVMLTIAGGTSEIVRNQIAERILGLPREPFIS
jgi:alkylation response protein AidB-like acyl-CoA dehydrogenase